MGQAIGDISQWGRTIRSPHVAYHNLSLSYPVRQSSRTSVRALLLGNPCAFFALWIGLQHLFTQIEILFSQVFAPIGETPSTVVLTVRALELPVLRTSPIVINPVLHFFMIIAASCIAFLSWRCVGAGHLLRSLQIAVVAATRGLRSLKRIHSLSSTG